MLESPRAHTHRLREKKRQNHPGRPLRRLPVVPHPKPDQEGKNPNLREGGPYERLLGPFGEPDPEHH